MCTNAALVNSLECYMDELVDCFEDFVKKSLVIISLALGTVVLMVMYVLKVLSDRACVTRAPANGAPVRLEQDVQHAEVPTPPKKEVTTQESMLSKSNKTLESHQVLASHETLESHQVLASHETLESCKTPECHGVLESQESTKPPEQVNAETDNSVNDDSTTMSTRVPSTSTVDEKVLREIGLSTCSKPCNTSQSNVTPSDTRIAIPCLPMCKSKHHLSSPRPCKRFIAIRTSCCSMCCVDDDRR